MNVLYMCADRGIPLLGGKGASVHLRSLTSAMSELGHRVTVVTRSVGEGNEPPAVARIERLAGDADDATAQIEALIADERPDVAIERYSLQSGAAREATARRGLALTLEVNAPLVDEATRFRGLDDPGARERERRALRSADRIQVVSSSLLRFVRSVAPGVAAAHIPNGADVARFATARPAALPDMRGRTVVGFVGSMKPWHGVEDLLEAFAGVHAEHPRAALALVGAGPLEDRLIERARQLALGSSVVFTGAVPHARIPSLVGGIDVGVAPYPPLGDFYFHPLKVVEYMAAGKPVVYSDQGDLRSLVGDAGLGYEPGSVEGLAQRLGLLLGDEALRARLADNASARREQLDWAAVAARVLRFASGESEQPPGGSATFAAVGSEDRP